MLLWFITQSHLVSNTILPFIIYLFQKNIFYQFIDCTILGLKTFQNNINLNIGKITIITYISITIIYLLKELSLLNYMRKIQKDFQEAKMNLMQHAIYLLMLAFQSY